MSVDFFCRAVQVTQILRKAAEEMPEYADFIRQVKTTYNGRFRRFLGKAYDIDRGRATARIELGPKALENDEALNEVVRHELAHLLVGCVHGHHYPWQAMARRLGCKYVDVMHGSNVPRPREWRRSLVQCNTCGKFGSVTGTARHHLFDGLRVRHDRCIKDGYFRPINSHFTPLAHEAKQKEEQNARQHQCATASQGPAA